MDHQYTAPVFDWEGARRLGQAIAGDALRIRVADLTDDQLAIAKLLGADPDLAERTTVALVHGKVDGADSEPGAIHIVEHDCPIVEWRGVRKIVLPNGDVRTQATD